MSRKRKTAIIAVVLLAGFLAGCEEQRREQKAAIDAKLPKGCELQYLGDYAGVRVVTIFCEGRPIQGTSLQWTSGKSSQQAVVFGGGQ